MIITETITNQGEKTKAPLNIPKLIWNAEDRKRVVFPTHDGYLFIKLEEISFVRSEDIYAYLTNIYGQEFLIPKTLKWVEQRLSFPPFFRIHRSFLINLDHINYYKREDGGYLIMEGGGKVLVSRKMRHFILM